MVTIELIDSIRAVVNVKMHLGNAIEALSPVKGKLHAKTYTKLLLNIGEALGTIEKYRQQLNRDDIAELGLLLELAIIENSSSTTTD